MSITDTSSDMLIKADFLKVLNVYYEDMKTLIKTGADVVNMRANDDGDRLEYVFVFKRIRKKLSQLLPFGLRK